MSWIMGVRTRVAQIFRRSAAEDRVSEEIRFHIEMETERNLLAGMAPAEARRRAIIAFGGIEKHRENLRDGWRPPLIGDVPRELGLAVRGLRRSPAFSAVVILTLAVGIGATTAIYSLVDGVLLRRIPFSDAETLVVVWETDRSSGTFNEPASLPDFLDFLQQSSGLASLAGWVPREVIETAADGAATRVATMAVTHEFLGVVGIEPLLGRGFSPDDDAPGATPVSLITEDVWETRYQRDPGILGEEIELEGRRHAIIGVLPNEADFGVVQILNAADYAAMTPLPGGRTEFGIWTPLPRDPQFLPRSTHPVMLLGRLAPGSSLEAAQTELAGIARDLETNYPENEARGVNLQPLTQVVLGEIRPALLALLTGVGLVLLIACANVANLLLARGASRGREVAVRRALGAGTSRLVGQFVAESVAMTGVAALLGIGIGWVFLKGALALAPGTISRVSEVSLDGRVLSAVLAVTVLIATVFGLVPTLQGRRLDIAASLTRSGNTKATGGKSSRRGRSLLVAAEVALAVVLLTAAGLLGRSFWEILQVDPGFRTAGVLKAELTLPSDRYPVDFDSWPNFEETHRLNEELLARIGALPGVAGVAVAGNHPLDRGFANSFLIVGREEESSSFPEIAIRRVTPEYFEIFGTSLSDGRFLDATDHTFAPRVAMINAAAAERLFPVGPAIGQQISFYGEARTIVGIIGNEMIHGLTADAPIAVYTPLAQTPGTSGAESLLVLAEGDPLGLADAVQDAIRQIDPAIAVSDIRPLQETLSRSLSERTFTAVLLGFFAAVALFLAIIGVHSVVSHAMTQRTRELGIRMALGASRPAVVRSVVGDSLIPVAVGLTGGLLAALLFARLLRGLLYGVTASDPVTVIGVALVILFASLLASLGPARRATGLPPGRILNFEF
jgi:predicted permease